MNKNRDIKIKQENTYGIGDDFMISEIKIGKTVFIVSSYFRKGKTFPAAMEKVIEHKLNAI